MRLDLSGSREQGIKGVNHMFTVIKRLAWRFDFDDITCFGLPRNLNFRNFLIKEEIPLILKS
jgi:hypothetical protein